MGFICKSFYVTSGSFEFPTGNTDALRLSRSQTLLTKCAQALIACNVGWQLDTSRNATDTSYVSIPDRSGNYTYPGLFFRNSISGCKLFMAYFGGNCIQNGIRDFGGGGSLVYAYDSGRHGGLCMSVIPDASTSEFGDPTQSNFLPADATRICGTCYYVSTSSVAKNSAAYDPTNGWSWAYYILATPYCVCVSAHHSISGGDPGLYVPVYACGRIFGSIAHEETTANAKYGTLCFRLATYDYEQWQTVFSRSFYPYDISYNYPWSPINQHSPTNFDPSGAISKSDGSWICGNYIGMNNQNINVCMFTVSIMPIDGTYSFKGSIGTRWSSIGMVAVTSATDKSAIEITPGSQDGLKGILDTDLFRACNSTKARGTTFDNDRFIILEDSLGWLFGWDPSNDPLT